VTDQRYPKSARLLKRRDFLPLASKGSPFYGTVLLIQSRPSRLETPRMGIIITKKFGKAHVRNRFKRLVREAFRLIEKPAVGIDFTVRPRGSIETITLSLVVADLRTFFSSFVKPPPA
jgi:ribonuclease P protein component